MGCKQAAGDLVVTKVSRHYHVSLVQKFGLPQTAWSRDAHRSRPRRPFATASCRLWNIRMTSEEVIDLSFCLVTLVTVAFLNSADQFFGVTLGAIKIVVRQLSPLRLDFTFELAPFPLQDVFIHERAPFVGRVQ